MSNRQLSRREMLQVAASATAAGVVLATTPRLFGKDEDPDGGFTLAVQSYTFRNFKLEPALKRIQDCGIRSAELFRGHCPIESTDEQIKAVLKLCGNYGVTPVAFGVEPFTKDHDANKKRFEFAKKLGVKHLSADPTPDSFESLDKLCEEYKISIAIHPHGPSGGKNRHRWWNAETILDAVKSHHPLIGTCLDTGHLIRMEQLGEKIDVAQQIKLMDKRNFGMHLKDHDNKRKVDVLYGQDGGVLDVLAILKALREVKFGGYIAIEYEAKPEEPTEDVKGLVKIFRQTVAKLA
jgi:inosose dehydratase